MDLITPTEAKNAADYAKSFIGTPYRWGGENPISGWDCSGFIQEILASIGRDPRGDQTAQGLYNYYAKKMICSPALGALAFYGRSEDDIWHVAYCLNTYQIIEAAGGGSKTTDIDMAAEHNAFVRIRPVMYRNDFIHCLKI